MLVFYRAAVSQWPTLCSDLPLLHSDVKICSSFALRVSPNDAEEKKQMKCVSSDDQLYRRLDAMATRDRLARTHSFGAPSHSRSGRDTCDGSRVVVGP